jgi:hypothetical protein
MQKDNMIYFYISDDQESLSHPYWRREMEVIYAQGPIEHIHLEPVPQVAKFAGLPKAIWRYWAMAEDRSLPGTAMRLIRGSPDGWPDDFLMVDLCTGLCYIPTPPE